MEVTALPEVVLVKICVNDRGDEFTYRWFTKKEVASFNRPNGTGSPDTAISDAPEFAHYCGIEIAEPYFGGRWPIVQNIIEESVSSFGLRSYELPYDIEARYHLPVQRALEELLNLILGNPGAVGKMREYMMVILTQLRNPDLAIHDSLGSSEPLTVKQLRMHIVRNLDSVPTDHVQLTEMFAVVQRAIDEYYKMPRPE